jgi:HNH endonuclease
MNAKVYERRITADNYRQVYMPFHPHAVEGWIFEHRLIMELKLGLRLPPSVRVHHRDCNPANNEEGNLLLCVSEDLHVALHTAMKQRKRHAVEAAEQSCREFERQLVTAAEANARETFETAVQRRVAVPTATDGEEFLKGLPKETQLELVSMLKRLTPANPRLNGSIGRLGARWTQEEKCIATMLHTHGADLDTVARIVRRPPGDVRAGLGHLSWRAR